MDPLTRHVAVAVDSDPGSTTVSSAVVRDVVIVVLVELRSVLIIKRPRARSGSSFGGASACLTTSIHASLSTER
jgi:hypothetical protein